MLQQQVKEITMLEKKLADFEYCILNFRELLNSHTSAKTNIKSLQEQIANDGVALKTVSEQIQKLEADFENIRNNYEGKDIWRQKAEELSKIVKILDLQERYQNFIIRISKGEKLVDETASKIEELKQLYEKFLADLKRLKGESPDMARLSKAKEWFTLNQMLKKNGQ